MLRFCGASNCSYATRSAHMHTGTDTGAGAGTGTGADMWSMRAISSHRLIAHARLVAAALALVDVACNARHSTVVRGTRLALCARLAREGLARQWPPGGHQRAP